MYIPTDLETEQDIQRQPDPPDMRHVLLREGHGSPPGQVLGEHTGEDPTVGAIELLGDVLP